MTCVSESDPSGSTGSVFGDGTAAIPSGRHSRPDGTADPEDFRRKIRNALEIDGFKFFLNDEQWVMIRPSGTEPVLRIYAEGPDRAHAEAILDATVATIMA